MSQVRKGRTLSRGCLMFKAETKKYKIPGGEKDERRDLILEKNARKVAADNVVSKAFVVWETLQVS